MYARCRVGFSIAPVNYNRPQELAIAAMQNFHIFAQQWGVALVALAALPGCTRRMMQLPP